MKKQQNATVRIKVTPSLHKRLKILSARWGISLSEVIRELYWGYNNKEE
jgi:hypothetical protein